MNALPRRRDDPLKQWPNDHHDPDRRRNRSATMPIPSYDPRLSSRPPPSHPPQTSKAYQHATRPHPQAHHYPQPAPSYHHPAYPAPSSSARRDPPPRRPAPPPHHSSYDHEDMSRPSRHPSRPTHSSMQPSVSAPPNHAFWNPAPEASSSRRHKDTHRDRDRERERDRDRDRDRERERERDRDRDRDRLAAELENRFKDKSRPDRHRERDRERAPELRYQDSTRSRHHDRRKDSDADPVMYSQQRNPSKASLSGREGYASSVRESGNSHRRHRTEEGTAPTGRRHQPENTQNPTTTLPSHSVTAPQPDVQQTGEPPPAPRVMPVYLPPKAKSQRSHREARPSTAQGAQSGSDTERAIAKHRMERPPSGPAVQRSDPHTSTSTRDRGNHDLQTGTRDDVKKLETKYAPHQDTRQPLAPINVDIPLVTPGFDASTLPTDPRASTLPQIVSIRAGQGPSDPHDMHYKSSAVSHSNAPQEIGTHSPHPTSASIIKSSGHHRSQPSETWASSDRPPLVAEYPRTEPRGGDTPPGQRVSIHESSRVLQHPVSRPPYTRANSETPVDFASSSNSHSRPPSRSANRISANNAVPPAVVGPRPLRSASQGPQTNDPPTRPPSAGHHALTISNQHSVPPSPGPPTNGSPPKVGHARNSLSSIQPSPRPAQLFSPSVPPSTHPTPTISSQVLTSSSRPPTRDGTYIDAHKQSTDQQRTADNVPEVKASWVVQTPATAKTAKTSREDKYLRDHLETPHAQLRQVLSQDDDFPRAPSSMMKASMAMTPSTSSQRNSPGAKSRDISFGTPRGTFAGNSPKSGSAKQGPTPEHAPRQNLPLHLAGPPQIAVVGATPITMALDLPQSRVDHALLAPPFPAPTRASRSSSSSQDQPSQLSQSTVRGTSSTFYQPQLATVVHTPSLFQPYQPSSPPAPEEDGQFSPPPLPIPPPRVLEDSPPSPIETRASEIIPIRSQTDGPPQNHVHSVPELQSEMIRLPLQSSAPSSVSPLRFTETWQPGKVDSDMVPMATLNGVDAKPSSVQLDDVHVASQEIMRSVAVLPLQSSAPARPRPKVTVEDVPEESPVSSKANPTGLQSMTPSRPLQPSHHMAVANVNSTSKSALDQAGHKSSPQSKSKDSMPAAPPMPPPSSGPAFTPSSAPLSQPIFPPSVQAASAQRATFHTMPSRTYQRAAEMLQASKLSTPAVINPVVAAGAQSSSAPRPANTLITTASYPSASVTPMAKVAASVTTIIPGLPGPHITAPPTSINDQPHQPPSASDPFKHQSNRLGPLSIPTVDTTTVMSTSAVKNTHQEQLTIDPKPRDAIPSTTRNLPSSSHVFPTSTRLGTSTLQTHVTPAQPSTHYRAVSLPVTSASSAAQKPPSPRKYSQPIPSTTVSTQTFPSRPPASESQPARVPQSGHMSAPAPARTARQPPPDRTNDSDTLKTPSSIAPSPMLNSDTPNVAPQSIAVPIRGRKASTESKDDRKKGLFGLFRARTLSSKGAEPPAVPAATRASLDQGRAHPDASVVASTSTPVPRGVTPASAPKESHPPPQAVTSTSTRAGLQAKARGRIPNQIPVPPAPTQTTRDATTPHIFTPFKFLTMHSNKRNRTVSAASLDVCDGNTATNTVVGSPDHSIVSQAQPLPVIIPPDIRDPWVATSEWRDREEAERRERRTNRIRRPGVTFDLEEEPPSPAPGTSSKRKKLVRRPSGRTPTTGPPRG